MFLAKYTWNHFQAKHTQTMAWSLVSATVCHHPPCQTRGLRQVAWTPHFRAAASSVSRLVLAPASNSLNEASRLNFFAGLCWGNSLCIRHARATLYIRTMKERRRERKKGRKKERTERRNRKRERVREKKRERESERERAREWETRITIQIYRTVNPCVHTTHHT